MEDKSSTNLCQSNYYILSKFRDQIRIDSYIYSLSDRRNYETEQSNVRQIYKRYQTKLQKRSFTKDCGVGVLEEFKFDELLRKQGFVGDITSFINEKRNYFVKQKKKSDHNLCIMKEYMKTCEELLIDHSEDDNSALMHSNLKKWLRKISNFYAALSERWIILESMLREMMERFDPSIIDKYQHKIHKKSELYSCSRVLDMMFMCDIRWIRLFKFKNPYLKRRFSF